MSQKELATPTENLVCRVKLTIAASHVRFGNEEDLNTRTICDVGA